MVDLHTHTYASDGVLGYAELARRCRVLGFRGLVISDHCDHGNLEAVLDQVLTFCAGANGSYGDMDILPGCELTHVPPCLTAELIARARELGAAVVLVHGETITEPVEPGTNRAAIEGGADIVAHPGLITAEEAALAAAKRVHLELSGRKGHALANGHVARMAMAAGAALTYSSDGHVPGDYLDEAGAMKVLRGAGLDESEASAVLAGSAELFRERLKAYRSPGRPR